MTKSVGWTIAIVLAASALCCAQESLGDVARQQKAATHAKAKRVVTDENLPHASAAEAANGAVTVAGGAKKDAEPGVGAKASASRTLTPEDAQKQLDTLKAVEEAQQRAVKKFEEELKDESIGAERRQAFQDGLSEAKASLEQTVKEREAVEQATGQGDAATQSQANANAGPTAADKTSQEPNARDKSAEAKADDTANKSEAQERKD
jgi:hypothetical protein